MSKPGSLRGVGNDLLIKFFIYVFIAMQLIFFVVVLIEIEAFS